MTLSEVKELREKYKDASHLHIGFYAGNILENEKNFVIWDDDHEMVHGVRINNDHYTQMQSPFVIMSAPYVEICKIYGFFN